MYWNYIVFHLSFSRKDDHTFRKLPFHCIALVVDKFTMLPLLPQEHHTCRKLTFYCITLVVVNFAKMWLFLGDYYTFCKLAFYCVASVVANFMNMWLLVRKDYYTFCKMTFHCFSLVVANFTRRWIFPENYNTCRKLTFYCIALVAVNMTRMSLRPNGSTFCKMTFCCIALVAWWHRLGYFRLPRSSLGDFLLHRIDCCHFYENVDISEGSPHIWQLESLLQRLVFLVASCWWLPSLRRCKYFLGITTHLASWVLI